MNHSIPEFLNNISVSWIEGTTEIHESRGFFRIEETTDTIREPRFEGWSVDDAGYVSSLGENGNLHLVQVSKKEWLLSCTTPTPYTRTVIRYPSFEKEAIWGCGTQLSKLNLKGQTLPILTREPGIGRGVQPLTFFMERMFGAGGEWHCTSAPSSWFLSSEGFGCCVENNELTRFDFQKKDEHSITVYAQDVSLRFFFGETPSEIIKSYTSVVGRFPILPDWIHQGAVIGLQGGGEKVRTLQKKLEEHKAPVAAFWLQDWVGGRKTSVGKQLWWNWELDEQRYPDWASLRETLSKKGIVLLSYINPFLVDITEKGRYKRNLLQEAMEQGFLVCNKKGEPYPIQNTSFFAYLIDLSNPKACIWIKEVIKTELIGSGVHGWMADFAEALPFDAMLYEGTPEEWHNHYPVRWAQINREAIAEAGREGDIIFFHRAGFTDTPKHSTLMWMGDQLAHWGKEDGLHSAVIGLLSSGFSGFSLNHGDIGGYISTNPPNLPFSIPGFGHRRTKELLMRWTECFSCTAVFRTHEGNQPMRHVQIDHDEETLVHFARFARLYAALAPYRKELCYEAHTCGWPLVRAMSFVFPEHKDLFGLDTQFFLGSDILVAPVLTPKTQKVRLFIPSHGWMHVWTREIYEEGWVTIEAPLGKPCILSRCETKVCRLLADFAVQEGNYTRM